jgi:hypothetical protein
VGPLTTRLKITSVRVHKSISNCSQGSISLFRVNSQQLASNKMPVALKNAIRPLKCLQFGRPSVIACNIYFGYGCKHGEIGIGHILQSPTTKQKLDPRYKSCQCNAGKHKCQKRKNDNTLLHCWDPWKTGIRGGSCNPSYWEVGI